MNRDEAIANAITNLHRAQELCQRQALSAAEAHARVADGWASLAAVLPGMDQPALMAAEPAGEICAHGRGIVMTGGHYSDGSPKWIHAMDGNLCVAPGTD